MQSSPYRQIFVNVVHALIYLFTTFALTELAFLSVCFFCVDGRSRHRIAVRRMCRLAPARAREEQGLLTSYTKKTDLTMSAESTTLHGRIVEFYASVRLPMGLSGASLKYNLDQTMTNPSVRNNQNVTR